MLTLLSSHPSMLNSNKWTPIKQLYADNNEKHLVLINTIDVAYYNKLK